MGATITRAAYNIKDGPNRETLFDAVKYALTESVIIPIHFVVVEDGSDDAAVKVKNTKIIGIDNDDNGSGHAFVIRGKMDVCFHPEAMCNDNLPLNYQTCRFEACYDTQTHRGRLMFIIVR